MEHEPFEAFRRLVLRSQALQEQLRACDDPYDFMALVVRLGQEHGYAFSKDDVEQAMRASRRAWTAQWIV